MNHQRLALPVFAALAFCATVPPVSADLVITGTVGGTFSGDVEEGHTSYGAAIGFLGEGIFGFEVEGTYTPHFFGPDNTFGTSNVTTLMGNIVLGVPIGGNARLYATGGVGLMKFRVPDAGEQRLVQEHGFQRRLAPGQVGGEIADGRQSFERVEPEQGDRRLVRGVVLDADATEAPWVRVGQAPPVVRHELDLPVAGTLLLPAVEREPARHPEVEREPWAPVELHPEVFAAPVHRAYAAAAQRGRDDPRALAREHDGVAFDVHGRDAPSLEPALHAPALRLDLGQLRHR